MSAQSMFSPEQPRSSATARIGRAQILGGASGWDPQEAWINPDESAKPAVVVRYRRPADRRTKLQRWADAVQELAALIDGYEAWKDNLPASLADSRD